MFYKEANTLNAFQQCLAVFMLVLVSASCEPAKPELRVYNETNYIEIPGTDMQVSVETLPDDESEEPARAY